MSPQESEHPQMLGCGDCNHAVYVPASTMPLQNTAASAHWLEGVYVRVSSFFGFVWPVPEMYSCKSALPVDFRIIWPGTQQTTRWNALNTMIDDTQSDSTKALVNTQQPRQTCCNEKRPGLDGERLL